MTISKRRPPASLVLAFPIQVARWDHGSPGPFSSGLNDSVRGNGGEKQKVSTSSQTGCRFQGPQTKGKTLHVDRMPSATRRGGGHPLGSPTSPLTRLWFHTSQETILWFAAEGHSCLDQNTAFPPYNPAVFTCFHVSRDVLRLPTPEVSCLLL